MTQLTIRNVDDDLAARVRSAAEESGDSINGLLLKVLRHQFGSSTEETPERNDLSKFRRGWVEDPEAEAAMAEFDPATLPESPIILWLDREDRTRCPGDDFLCGRAHQHSLDRSAPVGP